MSEVKRIPRIIAIIALVIGTNTFLMGSSMVLAALWLRIIPDLGGAFDVIGTLLIVAAFLSFISVWKFWPIAVVGLILSIVTLFIERNIYLRLLPFAFLIMGICIWAIFAFFFITVRILAG